MPSNAFRVSPVIGHRGAAARAPENTLASLREAARQGADWVEFDVKLTADGVVILLHDDRLERTSDGHGDVSEMTHAALSGVDAGRWFSRRFAGERIPTLSQAFALLRACGMSANIELKPCPGHEAATARAVAEVVRSALPAFAGDLVVSSFSEESLTAFAAALPSVSRALLLRRVPADWQARLRRVGADAVHCRYRGLKQVQIEAFVAAGYPVRCFTVNDLRSARRLWGWGVESLITDHPATLLASIQG